jgi:hypothetical protein
MRGEPFDRMPRGVGQPGQRARHVGKGRKREIRLHQPRHRLVSGHDAQPPEGETERGFRHRPEVLVAPHERSQPRVFELLLPPEERERLGIAGEGTAGLDHRVNVEERAVGVEDEGLGRGHGGPPAGSDA